MFRDTSTIQGKLVETQIIHFDKIIVKLFITNGAYLSGLKTTFLYANHCKKKYRRLILGFLIDETKDEYYLLYFVFATIYVFCQKNKMAFLEMVFRITRLLCFQNCIIIII